jgi:hypothetical protein
MALQTDRQDEFQDAVEAHDCSAQAKCYLQEAQSMESSGDIDSACFNYTHAYVLALDAGEKSIAQTALKALEKYGRE